MHRRSAPAGSWPGYALAALGVLAIHADGVADAAVPIDVIVIRDTRRGWSDGVLAKYGLAAHASLLNAGPQAAALREVVRDENMLARLAIPTACPSASTRDRCEHMQLTNDVDLDKAIANARGSRILVLWPEAGYSRKERLYVAYFDVDILEQGQRRGPSFSVGYRDWHCGADCVEAAYEASAKEMAAMVRFMLGVELGAHERQQPPAWRDKPQVRQVAKWANDCATGARNSRVIREYGARFWLSEPDSNLLLSTAWRGCNVFE